MLPNLEIRKYYEMDFKGVYLRNNLPKVKDGAYVINLDDYKSTETYWIALNVNGDNGSASYDTTYFERFEVECSKRIQ